MLALLLAQRARQLEHLADAGVSDLVDDLASAAFRGDMAAPLQAGVVVRDAALRRTHDSHQL